MKTIKIENWKLKIRLRTWIGLGIVFILLPIILVAVHRPSGSAAAWFDDSYGYRKKITFTHNAAITDDRRVSITVDTAALTTDKMQADCDDTRFTDLNGRVLRFQEVSGCDTATTVYDVVINPIANGQNVLYIYYGNPGAVNGSEDVSSVTSLSPSGADLTLASEEKGTGPVMYLSFDEGYGTSTNDQTANNNDGSITGATWKDESMCVSSKCLFFDGTDDVVTVANTVSGIQTVTFWVKIQSTSTTQELIDLNATDYITSASGTVTAGGFGTETIYVDGVTGTTLSANKWHQVTVTTSSSLSGSAIKIGQLSTNYGQAFIDEVKIYNYARSADQIKTDYQRVAGGEGAAVSVGGSSLSWLSDGLVGYWKMDDASVDAEGESSTDSSGNGNTGTLYGDNATGDNGTGMDCTASGKYGTGCSFDGVDDYVRVADPGTGSVYDITTAITISVWLYPNASQSTRGIVCKGNTTSWCLKYDTRTDIMSFTGNIGGSSSGYGFGGTVTPNSWNHVVVTYDSSNSVPYIYINGTQNVLSQWTVSGAIGTDNTEVRLGADASGGSNYFNGKLDNVRIYNRALSPSEVQALYNWAPGPVAYFPFDENSGTTTTYDKSGNGFTGTLTSITESNWTQGKFGSGLSLDGSADFVDIGTGPTQVNTVEFWVKPTTTTEYFVNLSGTTDYISASSGSISATGLSSPTIYVNGIASSTLTAGVWQHVAVTTATSENASNLDIGRTADANYLEGVIDEVKFYNYARTPSQIIEDMNGGHPVGGSPVASQVAYWAFDEQQGTTVNNSSTETFTTAISGATWKTSENCKINGCLDFDGTDDVLTITNESAIDLNENLAAAFTISAWVYADSDGEADTGQLFQKGTNTYCRTDSQSGSNLDIECSLDLATSDATLNISAPVTISAWNHVVVSYSDDADDEITIWVNGKNRGSSTNGSGAPATESSNLLIGGTTTANFDGKLDEFKIYSTELTEEQIKIDFNAGSSLSLGTLGATEATNLGDGAGNPPLGEWKFDEKTGSTAKDTSGNGYNATLNGNFNFNSDSGWVRGKVGNSLKFDGSNDVAQVANSAFSLVGAGSFTLETWVKQDTLTTAFSRIITYQQDSSNGYHLAIVPSNNGTCPSQFIFQVVKASTYYSAGCSSGNTISVANTWYHVVGVFDGSSNTVSIYVNGIKQTNGSSPASLGLGVATTLTFGSQSTAGSNLLDGSLDQAVIYNYARSQAQVAYDYNRGLPVAHWQFDECEGTIAYDASGNGNNGTITPGASGNTAAGNCESGDAAHMWADGASGKWNSSLGFDGTDDYVTISDTSDLRFNSSSNDFSIFAWVKRGANGETYVVSKEDADNDGWRIGFNSSNAVICSVDAIDVTSSSTITDTSWHHIGCVVDRDGNGSIYIDGQNNGSAVAISSEVMANTSAIKIGGQSYSTLLDFTGQIDEVQIYNYALSESQVRKIYNNGAIYFGPTSGNP